MHDTEFQAAIREHLSCCHGLAKSITAGVACLLLGCSAGSRPPARPPGPAFHGAAMQKAQFRLGARSARADIQRGTLAWEAQGNGESEGWRILWCFRKILAEKYGIEYRIRGHGLPADNEARIGGYQSVMDPYLSARLGKDWWQRIYAEAEALYRNHWHEVERQYYIDEQGQPGYEDYVRRHPISEEERRTRNPLDKFYDYRDEDPQREVPSAGSTRGLTSWEIVRCFFSGR